MTIICTHWNSPLVLNNTCMQLPWWNCPRSPHEIRTNNTLEWNKGKWLHSLSQLMTDCTGWPKIYTCICNFCTWIFVEGIKIGNEFLMHFTPVASLANPERCHRKKNPKFKPNDIFKINWEKSYITSNLGIKLVLLAIESICFQLSSSFLHIYVKNISLTSNWPDYLPRTISSNWSRKAQ